MDRPTYEKYWMSIAEKTAERSTCSRLHVGAVLVKENKLLATGYNGSAKGEPHCQHAVDPYAPCTMSIHAEVNCLVQCDQSKAGSEMFLTHAPCYPCAGLIINAGILVVHYTHQYRHDDGIYRLATANIHVSRILDSNQ